MMLKSQRRLFRMGWLGQVVSYGAMAACLSLWAMAGSLPITGPEAWFRPRDSVIYYLDNPKGEVIDLTLSLGDMNTYLQGERKAILWVIGPDGKTIQYTPIEDDRVVSGNFRFKEGMSDVYADARYRAWAEKEAGLPLLAGKERSPLADDPTGLAIRKFSYKIPASGQGVYRVVVLSCWDHWVSLETVPRLEAGIASGAGPLALRLKGPASGWVFNPRESQKVGISVVEEVRPFKWKATIKDEAERPLGKIIPQEFFNFAVIGEVARNSALKLKMEPGEHLATLHVKGIPSLLTTSAETAKRLRGGQLYYNGDVAFAFPQQVVLHRWLKSLSRQDLQLPDLTASLLPGDARFAEHLESLNAELRAQLESEQNGFTLSALQQLGALLSSEEFRKNHPSVARALALRVAVASAREAVSMDESFSYQQVPYTPLSPGQKATLWNTAYRTNWLRFEEADLANIVGGFPDQISAVMPEEVLEAWHNILDLWALARGNSALGECTNQWCMILSGMAGVQQITGNRDLLNVLHDRLAVMTDGNGLGRTNPLTPRASLGSAAGYGFASDIGMTGGGFLGEAYGYDAEYTLEQILYIHRAWNLTGSKGVLKWFNADYDLKTHLSLPWDDGKAAVLITDIVSPTDINFRTTNFTHKTNLPSDVVEKVRYGSLWHPTGGVSPEPWPCKTEGNWTKSIDDRFHFLNRSAYYAIVYTGETKADWATFNQVESQVQNIDGTLQGHIRFGGYGGAEYKGYGRKATKPGGISGVYVKGFGAALLSQNIDVPYTNTVWGRRRTPIGPIWDHSKHDPHIVAAAYDLDPFYEKAPAEGIFIKSERMRYAPLQSVRRLEMNDEDVTVRLDVTAIDHLDLVELYESLPLLIQSRTLTFIQSNGSREIVTPEELEPRTFSDRSWEIAALELTNAAGAGMRIAFSKPMKARLAGAVQYRPQAPLAASVQLILDGEARKGSTQSISYTISALKRSEPRSH